MEKQMTPQDIVKAEIESRGQGNDWRVAYLMLSKLINKPEWRLFRTNNTIFLIHNHKDSEKTVEFFIYNGASEPELKDNLREFFKALSKSGFKLALFDPVGKHTAETILGTGGSVTQSGDTIQVQL